MTSDCVRVEDGTGEYLRKLGISKGQIDHGTEKRDEGTEAGSRRVNTMLPGQQRVNKHLLCLCRTTSCRYIIEIHTVTPIRSNYICRHHYMKAKPHSLNLPVGAPKRLHERARVSYKLTIFSLCFRQT